MKNSLPLILTLLVLAGCRANTESIEGFVRQVELEARQEMAKLQPEREYIPLEYLVKDNRRPFELPKEAVIASQPVVKKDCWQPIARAKNGKLERYPLSQLRLKGVMGSGDTIAGLIQTPQGKVEKVHPGQFIGQNNGKVTLVTPSYILINETLPDGLGCWQQRKVRLALR
ncbi:pilus assembly protein PilP [Vibrio sp. IRLE0018]|uniref:pilus assembly protein PilP n=1 Tax=Vibrio TaxID=662 RepID=UPI00159424A1|nr:MULTISPECIES: pilus assembly protein PilP [Vibrio]MCF8780610.1 pilus assembly protein PilP [Vibrio floridensis]NVC62362.1 pilus assembly protein PilP [Vibrio sp. 05-20-BW147]HAS6349225.1 fimbrial protein [Vibrio vulnificus]